MAKVKIICDSAADVRREMAKQYDITIVPLLYTFDGENYLKDGIDLSPEEFYERIRNTGDVPKTSQATYDVWKEAFLAHLSDYDSIVCVTVSAAASGTCQAATLARTEVMAEYPDADITVIDSNSLSFLYGYVLEQVGKLAYEGADKDAVIDAFNTLIKKTEAIFLVEDLKYLKAGGRINTATLIAATLMDIKPILSVRDGLVVAGEKIRAGKNVYDSFMKHLISRGHIVEGKDIFVVHSLSDEKLTEYCETVNKWLKPASITTLLLGATIGSHAGPGLCSLFYVKD